MRLILRGPWGSDAVNINLVLKLITAHFKAELPVGGGVASFWPFFASHQTSGRQGGDLWLLCEREWLLFGHGTDTVGKASSPHALLFTFCSKEPGLAIQVGCSWGCRAGSLLLDHGGRWESPVSHLFSHECISSANSLVSLDSDHFLLPRGRLSWLTASWSLLLNNSYFFKTLAHVLCFLLGEGVVVRSGGGNASHFTQLLPGACVSPPRKKVGSRLYLLQGSIGSWYALLICAKPGLCYPE